MVFSKEQFVNFMDKLEEYVHKNNDIEEFLRKELELGMIYGPVEKCCDLIVLILQTAMNDENDWINYYIYELDFGKSYKKGSITDVDGTDIPLRNAEDLYKLLKGNDK